VTFFKADEQLLIAEYEVEVLKAKEMHGIMTRDPWLHYMSAKLAYYQAKKEADDLYITSRRKIYTRLQKALGNAKTERATEHVERSREHPGHSQ
jgi:hypothetical protein